MVILAYRNKLFTILVKVVMPMGKLQRILISVSAYISLFFLGMLTANHDWPGWLTFVYCFGLPLLLVKLIWYAADNGFFNRLQEFIDSRRNNNHVQEAAPTVIAEPAEPEPEEEAEPVEEEPQHVTDGKPRITEEEHEYRRLLQEYSTKLDARKAELDRFERDLSDREHTLELEKKRLATRERQIADREEQLNYRQYAGSALERMEEYKQQLDRAELKVLDWVKRREADEIKFFKGLQKEASRLDEYLKTIPQMSDNAFDNFIAAWLGKTGYRNIDIVQDAQDFNTDIIAYLKTIKYVFRCVYSVDPVGVNFIQSAFCAKNIHSANVGVAVTNSIFTKEAQIYAEEVGIILWDGENVSKMVNMSGGDC